MLESQFKEYITDFAKEQAQLYADDILGSPATNEEEMLRKEANACVYRFLKQLPDQLWSYIETKLPKE